MTLRRSAQGPGRDSGRNLFKLQRPCTSCHLGGVGSPPGVPGEQWRCPRSGNGPVTENPVYRHRQSGPEATEVPSGWSVVGLRGRCMPLNIPEFDEHTFWSTGAARTQAQQACPIEFAEFPGPNSLRTAAEARQRFAKRALAGEERWNSSVLLPVNTCVPVSSGEAFARNEKTVLTMARQLAQCSCGTQPTGPDGSLHEQRRGIFQVVGKCLEESGPHGPVNDAMIDRHRDIH